MGSRGVIARPTRPDSWEGVYIHRMAHPSASGRAIYRQVTNHLRAGGTIEEVWKTLITDHPAGYSYLPTDGSENDCYCHTHGHGTLTALTATPNHITPPEFMHAFLYLIHPDGMEIRTSRDGTLCALAWNAPLGEPPWGIIDEAAGHMRPGQPTPALRFTTSNGGKLLALDHHGNPYPTPPPDPEPQPAPQAFFEAGHCYTPTGPYGPTTPRPTFYCAAVVPDPRDNRNLSAVGFARRGVTYQWTPEAHDAASWRLGWERDHDTERDLNLPATELKEHP